MKEAPLPVALQLSRTLGGREVARAYDRASPKDKMKVRVALDLPPMEEVKG